MKYFLLFYSFFIISNATAQTNKISHQIFTKQDGLELGSINSLMFDDDGFLWLGGTVFELRNIILSDKKLMIQRFNGATFHSIPIPKTRARAISTTKFYKRTDGKFYIEVATEKDPELFLFDPISVEFTAVKLPASPNSPNSISAISHYQGVDYILLQHDRTISMNILGKDLNFTRLFSFTNSENKFRLDSSTKILVFPDYFVIGDDNFPITVLDNQGNLLKRYSGASFSRNRDSQVTKFWMDQVFVEDDTTYMFMRSNPQLHYWDQEQMSALPSKIPHSNLPYDGIDVTSDALGNHLVSVIAKEKLGFFDFSKNGFQEGFWVNEIDNSLAIKTISTHLEKDVWMATSNAELHHFQFPSNKVKTFLPNKSIRAMAPIKDDAYLVATERNGWYEINPFDGEILPYPVFEKNEPFYPNSARNLILDGDTIWSNNGGNILKINKKNGEAESFRHYPVTSLEKPNDTTLVYGTMGYNLMAFYTNTKEHKPLALTDTLDIYDIEILEGSDLVVAGTDKGVFTYHLGNKEKKFYDLNDYLDDPFVLMLDHHPDYGYLLGSRSGEIVAFDPQREHFKTIYRDDLKAGIATILFENETWWINTFNGVVAFDINNHSTTRFSVKDGLSDNEANRYSALHTEKGVFVGTINGLNYFNPNELQPEELISKLVPLKIRSYDSKTKSIIDVLNRASFEENKTIVLPSEYKELQVDFALTNNAENREHSYRYRLNSGPWTGLKHENSIRFPNMAPGDYLLEIEASNFSGNKIGESLFFQIKSEDFFYKTWWFYLLITILVAVLSTYFIVQAVEKKRLQEKFSDGLLLSQEAERTRIAKDLHDSVGQQLTLIKQMAQKAHQDEISQLTNNTLEEVRGISRNLYPVVLTQLGLSESIEQLIYDLDESTDIFFSCEIDAIDGIFSENDTLNFYRFIQENISNILKHSKASTVSLRIKRDEHKIIVQIEDNGIGFNVKGELKNKSLGLKTISERIRILKGSFQILSKPGEGTSINTEIPFK